MYLRLPSVVSFILLLAFSNMAFSQQELGLQWVKTFGGVSYEYLSSNAIDTNGNIYSVVSFSDTVDFDSGPGITNVIDTLSTGKSTAILKTDSLGNFLWVKPFNGYIIKWWVPKIIIDDSNNIILSGNFSGTVDFDLGPDTVWHTAINLPPSLSLNTGFFILKMTSNGGFIWVKILDLHCHKTSNLVIDDHNNILIQGLVGSQPFGTSIDFDPGPAIFNLLSSTTKFFLLKLNSNGDFLWVNPINSDYIDMSICTDTNRNIYFSGVFSYNVDVDPSSSYQLLLGQAFFVCKLDETGSFLWLKTMPPSMDITSSTVSIDEFANLYYSGTFQGIVDFDPGSGVHSVTSANSSSYILKLDSSGGFKWVNVILNPIAFSSGEEINTLDRFNNLYTLTRFISVSQYARTVIHKTDTGGNTLWITTIDSLTPWTQIYQYSFPNMRVSNSKIKIFGIYESGFDFAPGQRIHTETNYGFSDIYMLELAPCTSDSLSIIDTVSSCGSYTWSNDITYFTDTVLIYAFANQTGCDSLVGLNLTLTPNDTLVQSFTECDSLLWIDGNVYRNPTNSAVYVVAGVLTNGCDSVYQLDLNLTRDDSVAHVMACDSFTWIDNNTYYVSNNSASFTYTNTVGCDSTIWLDLFIPVTPITYDVAVACSSYTWMNGITYTASNAIAKDTLTNNFGCDSVIALNLTINNPTASIDTVSACYSYTWLDGITYTVSNNSATHILTNAIGCDSIITLDLTVSTYAYGLTTINACDSLVWTNGITYYNTTYGIYDTLSGMSAAGCDSVRVMNFIKTSNQMVDVITACNSYTWIDGVSYSVSNNTAATTYTNVHGCDSTITLDLTINYSSAATDTIVSCGSYTWLDGSNYTASNNSATHTLTNAAGCDSLVTLALTILNVTTSTDVISACDSYTWMDGNTYSSSNNTATYILINTTGCDSIITLDLTVNQSSAATDVISSCGTYTWIDGNTYNVSNDTAIFTLPNTAGCDSIITLDLTVNQSATATDVITACKSYTWINGTTYTSNNNSATHTLTSSTGCDSVVTLDLTITTVNIAVNKVDLTLTANATGATYQWLDCANNYAIISGETGIAYNVSVSGEYAVEVTQNGCTDTSTCYVFTNVGVNDIYVSKDISVYPNPTSDFVTIDLQKVNASKAKIVVVDFNGKVVYQEDITKITTPWTKKIDLSAFATGVYFVKVIIGIDEFTYQVSKL